MKGPHKTSRGDTTMDTTINSLLAKGWKLGASYFWESKRIVYKTLTNGKSIHLVVNHEGKIALHHIHHNRHNLDLNPLETHIYMHKTL
jgi:hypothetical protein